jgi:hypothetical protein
MTNYVKITDFAAKDAMLSGNPLKEITGTAHDNEFNAIAVAVASKADSTDLADVLETSDIGVSVQAHSANLDEYAAVNPTTAGLALLDDATSGDQLTTLGGTTVGKAVFVAATVAAAQQAMDVEVGVDVQAYDADTAKTDVAQTFTASQRGTVTTDDDLSFSMNGTNNFLCTPSAGGALTFTNITAGQSGNIVLVNGSNYAITADAAVKVSAACLATISATGTYWLSYFSPDGTTVYVSNTGALA